MLGWFELGTNEMDSTETQVFVFFIYSYGEVCLYYFKYIQYSQYWILLINIEYLLGSTKYVPGAIDSDRNLGKLKYLK